MRETYYSGDTVRQSFDQTDQPPELFEMLKEAFPWARKDGYQSISLPSYHELLDENVITTNLPVRMSKLMAGIHVVLMSRKFCMTSKTSFLRTYTEFKGPNPAWLPDGAEIMFVGENHVEFGRPAPEKSIKFKDYYFGGDNATIEKAFGLPERRGQYETWYGVTEADGEVKRVKQYIYDEQTSLSDWDLVLLFHRKNMGTLGDISQEQQDRLAVIKNDNNYHFRPA